MTIQTEQKNLSPLFWLNLPSTFNVLVKLFYFSDRDDVERTIWDPERAEDSTVSEQRKPLCNSGLTWQMDLGTELTYLRP